MPSGSRSEIVEVVRSTPNEEIEGYFRAETREHGIVALVGWVLGKRSRVAQVEVRSGDETIASTSPSLARPDIAEGFPGHVDAPTSGFEILIEPQSSGESHLVLEAQLGDGTTGPLGELRVTTPRRSWMGLFRPG